MSAARDLLDACETHSVQGIRAALEAGVDLHQTVDGKLPVDHLIEAYARTPRFVPCLQLLLDAGARIEDPLLQAVLLDDAERLRRLLARRQVDLDRRFDLFCAYTSLRGVSALHLCAEYNSVACAQTLLDAGMDVDVVADRDTNGLGGQTPIFHTVNSNRNHCRPTMELLARSGADLERRLTGLIWGLDCEWETTIFDVTPLSFAQCGLYPQFHRLEEHVYSNLDFLYRQRTGRPLPARNFPNRYVDKDFRLHAARSGQSPD